jgi:hypothetical protein
MSDSTDRISQLRGDSVGKFAAVENEVGEYIATVYFGEDFEAGNRFLQEIFEHDFFSFELKKRVFYKILKARAPESYSNFPRKEMYSLQKTRNIIAHSLVVMDNPEDYNDFDKIYFQLNGVRHNVGGVIDEFNYYYKAVFEAIISLPGVDKKVFIEP